MDHQVRAARITDVERVVALCATSTRETAGLNRSTAADLLRQLVYIPQASVVVVEARRQIVGGALLSLRPSVASGGFVGSIDLLVIDQDQDSERIFDLLIAEVLRSARNKGCVLVEVAQPADPAVQLRWGRHGFRGGGPRLEHSVNVGALSRPA